MRSESNGSGPRVVDFSTHLSGPLASHLLAEAGADVIKVESPRGGDGNRSLAPVVEGLGLGLFHLALNGGARSLAIDARSPDWHRVVAECVKWSDVVIVGSRPRDAAARGLDFASLAAVKPDIIYCQISGFGNRGPWRDYTAHGQTIDAMAGLLPLAEGPDGSPVTPPGWRSTGTSLGGVFAATGILAACSRFRQNSGAQFIDVSLWSSALWWSWRDTTALANVGENWPDYQTFGTRYRLYESSDRRVILIAPIEKKFWEAFCDLIDMPTDAKERGAWEQGRVDFGNGSEYAAEAALIASRIAERPLSYWCEALAQERIPFGPALTLTEAINSDHAIQEAVMRRHTIRGIDVEVPASPVKFGAQPETAASALDLLPPPELGEHTGEILAELGLDDILLTDRRFVL
jgi:crotonobetainyl-CoA:carnitine CoA-transferase CaiB-like acyl-CoA transferase